MATSGEKRWPPPGRTDGRHRGEPMAAHGENPTAVDSCSSARVSGSTGRSTEQPPPQKQQWRPIACRANSTDVASTAVVSSSGPPISRHAAYPPSMGESDRSSSRSEDRRSAMIVRAEARTLPITSGDAGARSHLGGPGGTRPRKHCRRHPSGASWKVTSDRRQLQLDTFASSIGEAPLFAATVQQNAILLARSWPCLSGRPSIENHLPRRQFWRYTSKRARFLGAHRVKPTRGLEPRTPSLRVPTRYLRLALVSQSWPEKKGLFAGWVRRLGKSWGNPGAPSRAHFGRFELVEVSNHDGYHSKAQGASAGQGREERSGTLLLRVLVGCRGQAWPLSGSSARQGLRPQNASWSRRVARWRWPKAVGRTPDADGRRGSP
jgi:hypothetical protein